MITENINRSIYGQVMPDGSASCADYNINISNNNANLSISVNDLLRYRENKTAADEELGKILEKFIGILGDAYATAGE